MRRLDIASALSGALAIALLTACAPRSDTGAEDAVLAIYQEVQQNIGQRATPLESIPMTDDLRALVERAEAAADVREEPFIDGDLAADCQDCASISGIVIGAQTGPEPVPAAEGHRIVEARFTVNGEEPRSVLYDMVQTPGGWRVDNILAHGFDLRAEAQAYLDDAGATGASPPSP
jgi:hypothetical protein